jgi:outer membrane protein
MGRLFSLSDHLSGDNMIRSRWWRAGVGLSVSMMCAMTAATAQAEPAKDTLSLKIASALRSDRLFMRAGAIYVNIKTKSGDTRDVTGPVIKTSELKNLFRLDGVSDAELDAFVKKYPGVNFSYRPVSGNDLPATTGDTVANNVAYNAFISNDQGTVGGLVRTLNGDPLGFQLLTQYLESIGSNGIGTPAGITGKASPEAGTAGISLGYFLDDEYKWTVESYVLAAPLSTSVSINGRARDVKPGGEGVLLDTTHPIAIDGQKIITSKLLPPTVILGRYWGDKDAFIRPYTGAMAMYAVFFDTKATPVLNDYVGGSNPGDTTVSIKNAFGAGPVLGFKMNLNDTWHMSLNVGHVKLKTVATITTRNTFIRSGSGITNDLGQISALIAQGEQLFNANSCTLFTDVGFQDTCGFVTANGGLTTLVSKGVAAERGSKNLGTYVRKTDTELRNTIYMLSVGRSF